MDAYHKILSRIYEISGGKDSVDVDLVELTKKEGYYPSIDDIAFRLKGESWVTESRTNVVRITHWGVAEAKKSGTSRPDAARAIERDSRKLLAETRELSVVIEEFMAEPTKERFGPVAEKLALMESLAAGISKTM